MQAQPQGGGGITIQMPTVDWQTLIPQLVGYFFDGVGKWLTDTSHKTLDGLWSGDHNVLMQTPMDLTWGFGPVHAQVADVQTGARAVLIFALVLLGLRGMLGSLVSIRLLDEFAGGVLPAVILVAAFPLLIPMGINLVNQAVGTVAGNAALNSYVSAGSGSSQNTLVQGVLFLILAFFAIRLLLKSIWRIGFLAVLLPVGPVACALYAVPQCRWILSWWARVWGGMLLAQIPSVFALSIGLGMFAGGGGDIGGVVWSIAFLQLATDMYSLIPFGHVTHQGSPIAAAAGVFRTGLAVSSAMAGRTLEVAGATTKMSDAQVSSFYGYR
jgi:hypothetical protein